jgi:hypothetical protein
MTDTHLTQDELKRQFHYNPDTGIFTRLSNNTECHCLNGTGVILVYVNKKRYLAHRLAWLYINGTFPKFVIDHINHIRHDNRIENLRPATLSQNQHNRKPNVNSSSGIKGLTWLKTRKKWRVRCSLNGVSHHLGDYADIEIAKYAYQEFAKKMHGEFYKE